MNSIFHSGSTRRAVTPDAWLSEVLKGPYCAVIFDCDGTLVHSADTHFDAMQTAVRAQGHDMESDWYLARTGLDRISIFAAFAGSVDGPFDASLAAQNSITTFIAQSASVSKLIETARVVDALCGQYPMAVGTNSEAEVAAASLKAVGLLDAFDHIVCVSDGLPPKPAPDIFEHATRRLGFLPTQTLVFEDSNEGVRAALSAGLDVIQIVP